MLVGAYGVSDRPKTPQPKRVNRRGLAVAVVDHASPTADTAAEWAAGTGDSVFQRFDVTARDHCAKLV